MSKINSSLLFIAFILLSVLVFSCTPEEEKEPRTRQQEWEELDAWMKRLEAEGKDIDTTDLTVFYIVLKPGEGPFPENGDNCTVSYYGFLPNGTKIDDSNDIFPPDGKWSFVFKPQQGIAGLNNAIGYMNKGAEIEMYIHSDFAYGSKGTSKVPPFTTLVYRATMHDIVPDN